MGDVEVTIYLTWEFKPLVYTIRAYEMDNNTITDIALAKQRRHPAFRDLRAMSDGENQA